MTGAMQDASGRTVASLERTLHTYRRAWEDEKAKVAARDAEWRAAVEREMWTHPFTECPSCTEMHSCTKGHRVLAHNAALDALLAAMEAK